MSQMVAPRDEVSLSIFATGAGILYYKWLKDGEEIAVHKNFNIHGVNRRILCIRHFLPQHEGSYKCVVSNKHGKVDSVSVLVKCLKIIEHPESKVYICGEDTFLKVVVSEEIAEKATLTYQWFKDDEYIKELPNCSGTDTPTLVITSLLPEHHGKYKCVIKDEDASMESKSATLFNSDNCKHYTLKSNNYSVCIVLTNITLKYFCCILISVSCFLWPICAHLSKLKKKQQIIAMHSHSTVLTVQTLQNHETSDANTNEGKLIMCPWLLL